MIPQRYDALLRAYGASLPLPLLRALAWHESAMNPAEVSPAGARGLLQVMPAALADYNRAHGTRYAPADLHRPDVNVTVAAWLLRLIVGEYARHHPQTLATDWTSDRFVGLVVLGWNRGFSERGGVGLVVGRLEAEGWPPEAITADAVVANAARAGASRTLSGDLAWNRAVVASYRGELPAPTRAGLGGGATALALALAAGTGVVYLRRR